MADLLGDALLSDGRRTMEVVMDEVVKQFGKVFERETRERTA
jgi:hypothetical protein